MEGVGEQRWDPESYAKNAEFNVTLAGRVLELLSPRPGERVLDLGCGDGRLTAQLVAAGCEVVGVDSSSPMVEAACARGLDARLCDAQRLAFASEFDAVFSNAALHWMVEADTVLAGVRRALRAGGRFVGEFGGHGVLAGIRIALRAVLARRGLDATQLEPWFFPTAEEYADVLVRAGFDVEQIELVARPTPLATGLEGWLETFAGCLLGALPEAERVQARDEVLALAAPVLRDRSGRWTADYVRLRFAARLPLAGA